MEAKNSYLLNLYACTIQAFQGIYIICIPLLVLFRVECVYLLGECIQRHLYLF
jgi:hypothetical protein